MDDVEELVRFISDWGARHGYTINVNCEDPEAELEEFTINAKEKVVYIGTGPVIDADTDLSGS